MFLLTDGDQLRPPQPFGVLSLIPGENLQAGVGVHHRKMVERLNNLKDLAARHVERADRIERAGRAQVLAAVCCSCTSSVNCAWYAVIIY